MDHAEHVTATADGVAEEQKVRCLWPRCPAWFDRLKVFGGDRPADWTPGWIMRVLSIFYLCPEHATTEHLPHREGKRVRCDCTWLSTPVTSLGGAANLWHHHLEQLGLAVKRDA